MLPQKFSAVETATINELIVETHRLTKLPLCIHHDDTMTWYGRIIRSHAILNSRKFGIPDNFYKVYSIEHDIMKFRTQIDKIKYQWSKSTLNDVERKLHCNYIKKQPYSRQKRNQSSFIDESPLVTRTSTRN